MLSGIRCLVQMMKSYRVVLIACVGYATVLACLFAVFTLERYQRSLLVDRWTQSQVPKDRQSTSNLLPAEDLEKSELRADKQSDHSGVLRTTSTNAMTAHIAPTQRNPDQAGRQRSTLKVIGPVLAEEVLEKNFYRKRDFKVNPYIYDVMINPEVVCRSGTYMIILVHSHHSNFEKRSAIRDSWGSIVKEWLLAERFQGGREDGVAVPVWNPRRSDDERGSTGWTPEIQRCDAGQLPGILPEPDAEGASGIETSRPVLFERQVYVQDRRRPVREYTIPDKSTQVSIICTLDHRTCGPQIGTDEGAGNGDWPNGNSR